MLIRTDSINDYPVYSERGEKWPHDPQLAVEHGPTWKDWLLGITVFAAIGGCLYLVVAFAAGV